MKPIVFVLLVIVSIGWGQAFAQGSTNSNHSEIFDVYSFSPHQLTKEQINEKSKVLDAFWQKAEAQPNIYLPLLQVELRKQEVPAFFLYDGSILLLRLSDTTENRRIALQAMARCDLRDVQETDYLTQVHRLAVAGEDTADAALHILTQTNFQAFIPQHSLTLGRDYALLYMLFSSDATNWLQKAITRLEIETDAQAQTNLLLLLWYQQANDSDRAIADLFQTPTSRIQAVTMPVPCREEMAAKSFLQQCQKGRSLYASRGAKS